MGSGQSNHFGYQIGRVVANSPAHGAGLVPFFDFILSIDQNVIADKESSFFREYLAQSIGRMIKLEVFNSKTGTIRDVYLTPSNVWGGQGLLGCSINWENIEASSSNCWHILDVNPGSNAAKAGVHGYRDFIVGMQAMMPQSRDAEVFVTMFQDSQDFHRRLQLFSGSSRPVLFLLYDSVANDLREVFVGLPLGCDVGSGYLHQIPSSHGVRGLPTVRELHTSPGASSTTPHNPCAAGPPQRDTGAPADSVCQGHQHAAAHTACCPSANNAQYPNPNQAPPYGNPNAPQGAAPAHPPPGAPQVPPGGGLYGFQGSLPSPPPQGFAPGPHLSSPSSSSSSIASRGPAAPAPAPGGPPVAPSSVPA
eukprot:RCo050440